MRRISRRDFVKAVGLTSVAGAIGLPMISRSAGSTAQIVVVGGGYGGATAAKYLKRYVPNSDVVLIEKNTDYYSCVFSNEVLSGESSMESIKFTYEGLAKRTINVVHALATEIDPNKKQVKTSMGKAFNYDYCVLSPGVSFNWGVIEGYDEAAAEKMPHAWKAGPQTVLLRKQLESMKDGGVVMIVAPPNPYRCPAGPYERAAQIAHYLKYHKPRGKVIIMDSKHTFTKQTLFMDGYKKHYGDMIEWRSPVDGGKVIGVDVDAGTLITDSDEYKPAVANVIPPQRAGELALKVDLADDSGWCPVDQRTFESKKYDDIFVIGDAADAGEMGKSGYGASSHAKICAAAIAARITGIEQPEPSYLNTCYSLITPEHAISVAMVYKLNDKGTIVGVEGAGGTSPRYAPEWVREREANYARGWFKNMTSDAFG